MQPKSSIHYRPEIDGLRAVAVIPVIFFHAGFNFFSGGFVGVDIFFVISGYLITAIIVSELEKGDFSLIRFYERRARRILPALFFVMLCCIPFAWLWMEPSRYKAFSRSLIAMTLFVSNFRFWSETSYFAPDADEKPLLHTWSLAVEEQFYLFFPLLLLLLWRFWRHRLLLAIASLAAISLLLSELGWRYAPSANFYLAPTRAWELYAGAICAFTLNQIRPLAAAQTKNLLSLVGFGMITAAVFFFSEEIPVPSLYALIPVVGTCLIILFADQSTLVARLLGTPALVGIGLISYSAYLWHHPLFAFARIRLLSEPSSELMLGLAALSFGLAYLTWRFVEKPFRFGHTAALITRQRIFGLAAAAGCIFIATGLFVNNSSFYLSKLSGKAAYYASYVNYANKQEHRKQTRDECFADQRFASRHYDEADCLRFVKDKPNYLLVGDSHAAHLSIAIREAFPDVNVLQATSSGCRPFLNPTGDFRCTKFITHIFKGFVPSHKLDGLILSGRWSREHEKDLDETMQWLSKYVPRIVLVGPNMTYTAYLAEILRDAARFGEGDISAIASRYIDRTRYPANETVRKIAGKYGAQYVDIISVLCPNAKCRVISATGEPMGFDRGHLTLSGSRTLMDMLLQAGAFNLEQNEPKRASQVRP